jgi:hypothetical protein
MKFLITFVALLLATSTFACDVCGCSGAGNTLGILPHYQRSFIGLRTFYQRYDNVNPLYEADGLQDYFVQTNLWGRYAFGKRWQIIGVLPYSINHRITEGSGQALSNQTLHGIGDASALVNFTILNTMDSTKVFKHHLMVGTGAKLPTGDFMEEELFADIPANFRLGTGSLDALFNLVYTLQYQGFVFSTNASYRLATENKTRNYQFGNQANVMTYVAYQQRNVNWAFQPYLGASFEYLQKDTHYNIEQHGTGGQAIYGLAGVEMAYNQYSFGVNWQMPISQNYGDGELENKGRFTASLTYLF